MMGVTGWEEQFFSADLSCSIMYVTELECTIADSEMNPPSFLQEKTFFFEQGSVPRDLEATINSSGGVTNYNKDY
jgi:hypothetical protein